MCLKEAEQELVILEAAQETGFDVIFARIMP
jgi:hypothetical protein